MNKKLAARIKALPQKPGVYLFQDAQGRFLYIGKAVNLRSRVRSHFERFSPVKDNILVQRFSATGEKHETPNQKPRSPKANIGLSGEGWHDNVTDIDFIVTANEKEALILENELIKKYKPKYNIQWQDDKSYFWVNFTNDEWPRAQVVHRIKTNPPQPSLKGGSKNSSPPLACLSDRQGGVRGDFAVTPIGPFTNGRELKQVLRALRKILPFRTCKNAYDKPCLQWHLGLCPAHDKSRITTSKSLKNPPQPSLKGGSKNSSPPLGGVRGDFEQQKNTYLNSLATLRQLLRLYAGEALRIEAYDISNIQGTNATGSMIVFKGFKRDRSQYRKFQIKTVRGANDIAMLKEVLRRRLNHTEWPLPDLILIDGGRAQLNAAAPLTQRARLALAKARRGAKGVIIPTLSLAKREEELYTIYSSRTLHLAKLPTDWRLLFQAIRNEAHRFAIAYYRKLHRNKIVIK